MWRCLFAISQTKAGMNVMVLQAMMGHASLDMTQRYLRLLDADVLEAHKAAGAVDRLLG